MFAPVIEATQFSSPLQLNELKSLKLDLEKDLRDCKAVIDKVRWQTLCTLSLSLELLLLSSINYMFSACFYDLVTEIFPHNIITTKNLHFTDWCVSLMAIYSLEIWIVKQNVIEQRTDQSCCFFVVFFLALVCSTIVYSFDRSFVLWWKKPRYVCISKSLTAYDQCIYISAPDQIVHVCSLSVNFKMQIL